MTSGLLEGLLLAALAGAGAGRAAWSILSASSDRRVHRLARRLAEEAASLSAAAEGDEPA